MLVVSCVEPQFKPRNLWPTTTITFDDVEKALTISSSSFESAFREFDADRRAIRTLEISNVECDFPSLERKIFWCRLRAYKNDDLPVSVAKVRLFNGDSYEGVAGGNLNSLEVVTSRVGFDRTSISVMVDNRISMQLYMQDRSLVLDSQLGGLSNTSLPICSSSMQ
ncbi:MAG: hypothetical protein R3B45_03005 [Bdellovibrionota bacterium]